MPQSYFIQDASAVCTNSQTMLVLTAQQRAFFEGRKTDSARPPGPQISQSCEPLCARVNTCDVTLNLLALSFRVSLPQAAVVLVDGRRAARAQSAGPLFQRSSEHQPGARRTEPGRPAEGAKAEAAPARPRVKMARSILVLGGTQA
jgi:hypothetical protein